MQRNRTTDRCVNVRLISYDSNNMTECWFFIYFAITSFPIEDNCCVSTKIYTAKCLKSQRRENAGSRLLPAKIIRWVVGFSLSFCALIILCHFIFICCWIFYTINCCIHSFVHVIEYRCVSFTFSWYHSELQSFLVLIIPGFSFYIHTCGIYITSFCLSLFFKVLILPYIFFTVTWFLNN